MTQSELNRAVAKATGETVRTVANFGFIQLTAIPIEREPLVIDKDNFDADCSSVFLHRKRHVTIA
jgi:hypothetical protein